MKKTKSLRKPKTKRFKIGATLSSAFVLLAIWQAKARFWGATPLQLNVAVDAPAPLSSWPWRGAAPTTLSRGVTHWSARQNDGTLVEMLRFDFKTNPNLRFELYDQDSDDAKPWDNQTFYNNCGVGEAVRRLNQKPNARGVVVAAWNGPFFGYLDGASNPRGRAHHVAPVVINGETHAWGANHRWTFGVAKPTEYSMSRKNAQRFQLRFLPSPNNLAHDFGWASGGLQCLLRDGKPLKLQPFPKQGDAPIKQPVASTSQKVGHIPDFDHMRSSRASFGWTANSSQLYVLWVKEPDNESASIWALRHVWPLMGGWTVADVQRFWLSMKSVGVVNAVNSDAGKVLQYAFRRADHRYDLVPPRGAWVTYDRAVFDADFADAPAGGALMYFAVRDVS